MSRRRILWLSVPFVLLGIAVAAWFVLARRDADFVTVGPKTVGVRHNFAKLDTSIDPADFRECKTVRDAIARLIEKTKLPDVALEKDQILWAWRPRHDWIRIDDAAFVEKRLAGKDLLAARFTPLAETEPITVKQFLRLAFAQTGASEVNFVVRGHYVEATTATRAQEERRRYLETVSAFDRVQNLWKELTGKLEADPPEMDLFSTY